MDSPSVIRRRQEMAAFAAAQAEQAPPESACLYCRGGGCPYCQAVPESEAASEPAAERPSLLSRLMSWRASQEPEEDTPAAPAREEAGSTTQTRAPEAAADEESGAVQTTVGRESPKQLDAEPGPPYAWALAATFLVCLLQLLALLPSRHWASIIFEHNEPHALYVAATYEYRVRWDIAYDLWGWDAIFNIRSGEHVDGYTV